MGQLYDMVQKVDELIAQKGLPFARTKGLVVIKAGFSLVLIARRDLPAATLKRLTDGLAGHRPPSSSQASPAPAQGPVTLAAK